MPASTNQHDTDLPFLAGGGRMGELICSIDWPSTKLGDPALWPVELKNMVSMMLTTTFPVLICWGENYIQLYNDAFRPILGATKHPQAMGGSAKDTYAEIWETIGPMFAGVMGGTSVGFPDFMVPLDRNGGLEDCYFDFSYSPIRDDKGHIGGVLVICMETTEKVKALKRFEKAQNEALGQRDRLNSFFMQAPSGICILDGPGMVFELVNPLYQQLFPGRPLLGKPVLEAVPEIKGQPIWDILWNVYTTGDAFEGNELLIPLARTVDGPVEERYFNFVYQARLNGDRQIDGIMVFVNETTEQVMAKRQLKESEQNLQLLADNISQLAWMTDETGYIFWYNKQWYDYTGTTLADMQGWGWKGVHHPDHLEGVMEQWSAHIQSGETFEQTFPIRSKTGDYRWFLTRAVPFKDDEGKVLRWFGTNTDITEQRELVQQKDDFISIASHELKTPITSLKASLQLLNKIKDDPSATILPRLVEQANRSTNKVSVLVEDLLNASKFNQGQLSLNKKLFTFKNLTEDCCDHVLLDNAYTLTFTGDLQLRVYADKDRVGQVIVNIVNNAIKYAPNSKEIKINFEKIGPMAKVSISDKGPGIPSEKLPHLFERYFRVDESGTQYSGLGLGLYICAEIIKKHNGQIGAESKPGEGSTFWFTLPLA